MIFKVIKSSVYYSSFVQYFFFRKLKRKGAGGGSGFPRPQKDCRPSFFIGIRDRDSRLFNTLVINPSLGNSNAVLPHRLNTVLLNEGLLMKKKKWIDLFIFQNFSGSMYVHLRLDGNDK